MAGGGRAGFCATGRAYVRFALANPALFRLIFSNPPEVDGMNGTQDDVPQAFRMLRENVATILPSGADGESIKLAAFDAWAKVHGLAVLMLHGQIARDEALIDAMIR